MTRSEPDRAALGVGRILGQSMSILFRQMPRILLLACLPALETLVMRSGVALWIMRFGGSAAPFVPVAVHFIVTAFMTVLLIGMTADIAQARPVRLWRYAVRALRAVPLIALLMAGPVVVPRLVNELTGDVRGFLLAIALMLWVQALLYVVAPAMALDRAGLRGFGRSVTLTKGYRWPIIGMIVLFGICVTGLKLLITYAQIINISYEINYMIFLFGLSPLVETIGVALAAIAATLTYLRLREIEEGSGSDDVTDIFD